MVVHDVTTRDLAVHSSSSLTTTDRREGGVGVEGGIGNERLGKGEGMARDKTGEMNLQPEKLPRLSDKCKNELQGREAG